MNNYMLPDFATWIRQAYREPESTSFTIHNMEVAYHAGRASHVPAPAREAPARAAEPVVAQQPGAVDLPEALRSIQRYKIGYHSDEWGVRMPELSPFDIPDASGSWVRYADHIAFFTASLPLRCRCQQTTG